LAENLNGQITKYFLDIYPVRNRSPQGGRSRAFGGAVSNGVYPVKLTPLVI